MVEKRYVAKKRVPEYCPFGSVMVVKVDDEGDAPAQIGRVIGFSYEGSNKIESTLDCDKDKPDGERVVDRLLYDGYLTKHVSTKSIQDAEGNPLEIDIVQYGIIYESEDGPQQLKTCTTGIPMPSEGRFQCALDIQMNTRVNGENLERHIIMRKTTPMVFRYTFLDFAVCIRQDIISMLYKKINSLEMADSDNDTDRCVAQFYDEFGEKRRIEFDTVKDLLATIVSIRLVDVKRVEEGNNRFAR